MTGSPKYGPQYVADECGVSVRTARRWMRQGRIRSLRISEGKKHQHLRTLPEYVEEFKRTAFAGRAPRETGERDIALTLNTSATRKSSGVIVTDTPYRDTAKKERAANRKRP